MAILTALVVCTANTNSIAWETSANTAYQVSRETGRPLMILGTTVVCGPCQKMKAMLSSDAAVQTALADCVLLVLDANEPEFQSIVARYGIPVDTVPMVYVVGADDRLIYAQPGALDSTQVQTLLASAIEASGPRAGNEQIAQMETRLDEVRSAAKDGDLLTALRVVTPLANHDPGIGEVVTAQSYRDQLVAAIDRWIDELDGRMAQQEQHYEAAYHLVKIYAHTPPQYEAIRESAFNLVDVYENQAETQISIKQAKYLVRARLEEHEKRCDAAIRSYENVETLDPNSPAGKYARQRIPMLRKRQATKLGAAF